jgi:hypothetical protein
VRAEQEGERAGGGGGELALVDGKVSPRGVPSPFFVGGKKRGRGEWFIKGREGKWNL